MGNEKLITCCGLYCGDCYGYNGKIASLAGKLNEELDNTNFKKNADHFAAIPFFNEFKNYERFVDVLKTLKRLTCEGCGTGEAQLFVKLENAVVKKKLWAAGNAASLKAVKSLIS
ncbi:MAG: DUF3795 domain-containing protein [Methanobacterium sp.]